MVTPMSPSSFEFLHPDNWIVSVFVAGQVGWNAHAEFESNDFIA